jgi:hypothetical protein
MTTTTFTTTFARIARSTRDGARVATAGHHRTEFRSQAVLEAVAAQRVGGALR